jgi:predicted dehydrogenase
LGPAPVSDFNPQQFHSNFKWFWDFGGGIMADRGSHLIDVALKGINKTIPNSVMATGGNFIFSKNVMETPDTFMSMFDFGHINFLWDHSVGTKSVNYSRKQGVAFIGTSETVIIDENGWEVIPLSDEKSSGKRFFKSCGNGLDLHVANFLDCVKFGGTPNCDIETAAKIANVTHMANISYRLGRKVFWNEEKQMFENDVEANKLATTNYRSPWKLPLI